MSQGLATAEVLPEVRLSCDMPGFLADWRRCDQVSNYLAESLSLAKADPFAFSSMLSTIINEVLETIFCHNAGEGPLTLELYEEDDTATVLRAEFAVDDQARAMYERIRDTLASQDPVGVYEQLLFQVSSADARDICLYEIAADYGARLTVEPGRQAGTLCLVVRVGLNEWLKNRGRE